MTLLARFDRFSDRQLATLIGATLFVVGGWPLIFLHFPPYQDLPDHLATVRVLLDPHAYPEYVSNGWLKADSLFLGLCYALSKQIGLVATGRVFAALAVASTAFALPHFTLSFTDRRRLSVASLLMVPMVHNWWILMGMLSFAISFPLALVELRFLARQVESPTWPRGVAIGLLGLVLWLAHAVMLLLVGLLALVDVVRRLALSGAPRSGRPAGAVIGGVLPLLPAGVLVLVTIVQHATRTTTRGEFGRVSDVMVQDNWSNIYDLWAHWSFGLSPLSAASLVSALTLAVFAARAWRAPIPMFSSWALAVLFSLYWLLPNMMPGFGYVNERPLPLLWAWALVRVPPRVPKWLTYLLLASGVCWSAGLAADLFRAERDLDDFVAAAASVPPGARILTLNFAPRVSSTNTWPLLHASGMYTVLGGAKPQDVWADSPSAEIRHAHPPALVEDPVRIRQFLSEATTARDYCAKLTQAEPSEGECETRWRAAWAEFWTAARARYDFVLFWSAPAEVVATIPPDFVTRLARGRLELRTKETLGAVLRGGSSPH